jgi:hypothetical protein
MLMLSVALTDTAACDPRTESVKQKYALRGEASQLVLLSKYCSGDETGRGGGTCGANAREATDMQDFGGET